MKEEQQEEEEVRGGGTKRKKRTLPVTSQIPFLSCKLVPLEGDGG